MSAYDILIQKLKEFIKKYYKNILLKGVILFFSILFLLILIISFSEYFGHFSISVRTFLFYFFVITNIFVLVNFIIIPALKIFNFSKTISFQKASLIISDFFPSIQDKLINTLELYKMNSNLVVPDSLITAGIEQKINEVSVFSFTKAIDFKENLKYLKILLPILFLFILLFNLMPSQLFNSSKRLINHAQFYEKPSTFKFLLLNDSLNVTNGEDYLVKVEIQGEYIPKEVYINISGNEFLMKSNPTEKTHFTYSIKNLNNDINFSFNADDVYSKEYFLKVFPSPLILNFYISAFYPKYTGIANKQFENIGDLTIPEGTTLTWNFNTQQTDELIIYSDKKTFSASKNDFKFIFSKRILNDFIYSISIKNQFFSKTKYIDYKVFVKKDLFPSITVNQFSDSANFFLNYFKGNIEDDYGFSNLTFNFRLKNENETGKSSFTTIKLKYNSNVNTQEFFHLVDFSEYLNSDKNTVEYYFEVFDNDGVNGAKSSKSDILNFKIPTKQEIRDFQNESEKNLQSKIDLSINLANQIKEDFNLMKENNLNSQMSEWENTQMLKDISQKQNLLEKLIDEISLENKEKNLLDNTFDKKEAELLQKQQEIEKLMDELMTDEMKEMMKKINELQENFDKKLFNELMEQNEMNFDQLSEKLDRNKELLKRYEVEKNIDNSIEDLKNLAEKQDELSQKSNNKKSDLEQLKNEQNQIEEEFKKIEENYKETLEKNKELSKPMNLEKFEEDFNKIKEEFNKTDDKLSKDKKSDASKSQKSNSQNMKSLSEKMNEMQNSSSSSQNGEDITSMKKLLNSLLNFSFEQENVLNLFRKVSFTDPNYIRYSQKQVILKDNFSNINDSLTALSKRQTSISSAVMKELDIINANLASTISLMEERKINDAVRRQIIVMTSANNLAILFSNIIKSMEEMQSSSSSSSGKGKPTPQKSLEDMQSQQESLKKQMEDMLKKLEKGEGSQDQKSLNKQFAQMLAQQEIFRQMMQDMKAKFNLSPETQKILNEIEKLSKQNERDMVNKSITPQMINRQKQITTRLLEAEKAENQRETENKRESEEGNKKTYKSPEEFFDKYKNNSNFNENLYNNYNYKFKLFYKNLNNNYYEKLDK
jgi:hypothetical protein